MGIFRNSNFSAKREKGKIFENMKLSVAIFSSVAASTASTQITDPYKMAKPEKAQRDDSNQSVRSVPKTCKANFDMLNAYWKPTSNQIKKPKSFMLVWNNVQPIRGITLTPMVPIQLMLHAFVISFGPTKKVLLLLLLPEESADVAEPMELSKDHILPNTSFGIKDCRHMVAMMVYLMVIAVHGSWLG